MTMRRSELVAIVAAAIIAAMLSAGCSSSASTSKSATTSRQTSTTVPGPKLASGPSKGCQAATPAKPGTFDEKINSGGKERSYELIVPTGYDGSKPLPLVFGLHSLTIDYHVIPMASGFNDMEKRYDFILVAPSGLLGEGNKPYWNAAPVKDNYDVTFLTDLLDHLEDTLCVDTAKVVSIGMSNGAQMSSLLACRLAGRITGVGAISGVEYNQPCQAPPVPIIAFHGTKDPFVPYTGGGLNSVKIADRNFYHDKIPAGTPQPGGVDASMAGWAKHNGCRPTPAVTNVSKEVELRTWRNCGELTELYVIKGAGHTWPGLCIPGMEKSFGTCTTDIKATELMFAGLLGAPAR